MKSLVDHYISAQQKQNKKKPRYVLKKSQTEEQKEKALNNVLTYGGEHIYTTTINGKKKNVRISVKTDQRHSSSTPVYKFHILTAMGHRLFVKATLRQHAQQVVDEIYGKNMYRVSGTNV